MESSWRWNAWWANGLAHDFVYVARLLTPILGREYLACEMYELPRLISICNLDTSFWWKDSLPLFGAYEFGFPYGIEVDQHKFG